MVCHSEYHDKISHQPVPSCPGHESPLCPAYPTHKSLRGSLLGYQINCRGTAVLVFKPPLFYLIMAPKCKSSDAGNLDLPNRSPKVLPLSKQVKVLNLIRKEKNYMLRLTRSTVETNLLSMKL